MGWLLVRNSEDRMLQGPMLLARRGQREQLVSGAGRVTVFPTSAKAHRVKQAAERDWLDAFNKQRRAGSAFNQCDDYIEVVPLYPHGAASTSGKGDDHDDGNDEGPTDVGAAAGSGQAPAGSHAPAPRRDLRRR